MGLIKLCSVEGKAGESRASNMTEGVEYRRNGSRGLEGVHGKLAMCRHPWPWRAFGHGGEGSVTLKTNKAASPVRP